MSTLTRRPSSPVSELLDWLDSGTTLGLRGLGLTPYVRVEDFTEDGTYVLRAEMPGIDPDKDVTLNIEGDLLTIRGERREEEREKTHHEFHYGAFTRSLRLPHDVQPDEVKASYTDGVLEVRVPLHVGSPEPVTIPVVRGGDA
ncbi:Hsp20/alpha crystallin family protein [Phycicoccus sp.]|uniref:Hsp20/alpha crystallin family protein n=1 Tax=Phycicoccus sp. TaxID=1902410 RepID=UPI002CE769F3|nr:Hsp20/alpha crystallin family protein [Phycicoccus sp.]HMM94062.1 Hsp20/alpha crystallin family protein [Phycicoccus sp.]